MNSKRNPSRLEEAPARAIDFRPVGTADLAVRYRRLYGLPCPKCGHYYFSDERSCPICERQRGNARPHNGNGNGVSEVSPLIFRIRRNVQRDGRAGVLIEVQARVTNDKEQDRETASCAYELLQRLASHAAEGTAPSKCSAHEFDGDRAILGTG